ncbi:hypothetical protein Bcsk_008050 [Bartonella sp. CDC_skunk]|uniref:hypothetical protein n=1 Tax=unclassified Bartonella TaxID=2645622 RepID=UPI00099A6D02|nr:MULTISPECIES: hypothetical protein [unclassified Bartonella]AQX21445.1 hypothetical protein Bcsk_008050 [Bartonella sp. CDC_skunk]AQX26707.1 hypothetical protein Bra60_007040 [Bartonella sp. Raccoon60]
MIEKKYPIYDQQKAVEKRNCKWSNSIGKSIFTIILSLLFIWLIVAFLGSFWNKSSENIPNRNKTGVNQTTTNPTQNSIVPPIP